LLGRFLSIDPVNRRAALKGPQFFNRYTYTGNNPLKYVDPNGECAVPGGLKGGQVGICIESFIAAPRIGGLGFGDNRGFESNDPDATFRTSVRMIIDPESGQVLHSRERAGVSEAGLFKPMIGLKGVMSVHGGIGDVGNGDHILAMHITGDNGFSGVADLGVIGIFAHLTIDRKGGVTVGPNSVTKWFPSIEGYAYRIVDGELVIDVLFTKPEEDPEYLKGPMDRPLVK